MQIVLAENFQNDTVDSILTRYPGTTKSAAYTVPSEWVVDATSVLNCEKIPTSGFTRVEFYVTFTGTAGTSTAAQNFFGVTLATPAANQLAINGNTLTAPAAFSTSTYLHLVFEQQEDDSWMGYAYSDNGLKEVFVAGLVNWTTRWVGAAQGYLPNRVTSVLIVHDTEPGTRLSSITWENAVLTVDNQGTWQFSQDGFVEDTDKSDPTVTDPKIYTSTDEGIITFDTNAYDAVVWHVAGRTDNFENTILQMNSSSGASDSFRLIEDPKPRTLIGSDLQLAVRPPTTKVIAQPDFSRMNTSQVAMIDDYSENPWTYSTSWVAPSPLPIFGEYPKSWYILHVSSSQYNGPVLELPGGFGLHPFTIEGYVAGKANASTGGNFGLGTASNWIMGYSSLYVGGGTSAVGSIAGPGVSFDLHYFAVIFVPTSGKSGYCYGYLDGNRVGTTSALSIGPTIYMNARYCTGVLLNLRITEDILYSQQATIPVPTAPWPKP